MADFIKRKFWLCVHDTALFYFYHIYYISIPFFHQEVKRLKVFSSLPLRTQ